MSNPAYQKIIPAVGCLLLVSFYGAVVVFLGLDYVPFAMFVSTFCFVSLGAALDALLRIRNRGQDGEPTLWILLRENFPMFFMGLGSAAWMLGSAIQLYIFGNWGQENRTPEYRIELRYRSAIMFFDSESGRLHDLAGDMEGIGIVIALASFFFAAVTHLIDKGLKRRKARILK